MKKLLIILFTIIGLFGFKFVKAEEIKKNEFVINDWVDLYYSRNNNGNVKKGRFVIIRNKADNNFAYCIEPLKQAKEHYLYSGYSLNDINQIDSKTLDKISLLSYYGYMYKGHEDKIWYAVTQFLIWKTVAPNLKFELLDKTKENIITNNYLNYIKELETLVNEHYQKPIFKENLLNLTIKKEYKIKDINNLLNKYDVFGENVKVINNEFVVKSDQEKEIKVTFKKKIQNINPIFVYYDQNYQSLMTYGKVKDFSFDVFLKFNKGKIVINKIDKDTKKFENNKNYSLKGTVFKLYDENDNFINKYIVEDDNLIIDNLEIKKYYLVEETAGKGYKKSDVRYIFDLTKEKEITKQIENEKILKEITILKYMGDKNNKTKESGIKFQIYLDNILFKEIVTDEEGKATFYLPYGNYEIKQVNSTVGYKFINDFNIEINDNISQTYELLDLKIPDAGINKKNNLLFLIIVFSILIGLNIYDKIHNKNI